MMKPPKQHMTDNARLTTGTCRSETWPLTAPDDPDWDEIIPYELTDLAVVAFNHPCNKQNQKHQQTTRNENCIPDWF